jgi:flagellum-specific ATP synthase
MTGSNDHRASGPGLGLNEPSGDAFGGWSRYLADCGTAVQGLDALERHGRLVRIAGLVMEAAGLRLPIGSTCLVEQPGQRPTEAEVVGFAGDRIFLMPTTEIHGLAPGARVSAIAPRPPAPAFGTKLTVWRRSEDKARKMPVGPGLLGRVIDGAGRPLDKLGPLVVEAEAPIASRPLNPIDREPISRTLDVGVRAINALLTVGCGQRMGLFAGSGVGKSVLLGMMARYTKADVIVVGLIGERGREVKEFIEQILGEEGLRRSVVVAAPADTPPLMRLHGAAYATTIAEYFRDQGKDVLLIMDSLTRFAMAQREIALAIHEPPATKGYPPSVFAKLPQLVERAGMGAKLEGAKGGSITAFYTVLTEGDDPQDPIADAARAILDGHIVLSRELADQGHYPAIDVEQSVSRAIHSLVDEITLERVKKFKQLYARYHRNRDLVNVGAYAPGSDPLLDRAIAMHPRMEAFLQQNMRDSIDFVSSAAELEQIFA